MSSKEARRLGGVRGLDLGEPFGADREQVDVVHPLVGIDPTGRVPVRVPEHHRATCGPSCLSCEIPGQC